MKAIFIFTYLLSLLFTTMNQEEPQECWIEGKQVCCTWLLIGADKGYEDLYCLAITCAVPEEKDWSLNGMECLSDHDRMDYEFFYRDKER